MRSRQSRRFEEIVTEKLLEYQGQMVTPSVIDQLRIDILAASEAAGPMNDMSRAAFKRALEGILRQVSEGTL